MSLGIRALPFLVLNLVFISLLVVIWLGANEAGSSSPIPVYGDWKYANFVHINFTDSNETIRTIQLYSGGKIVQEYYLYSDEAIRPNLPHNLINLTFVSATLRLRANFTKPSILGTGRRIVEDVYSASASGGVTGYPAGLLYSNLTGIENYWVINVTYVEFCTTLPKDALLPSGSFISFYREDGTKLFWVEERGMPCFFWTNNGTVSIDYIETYKYIPIDHYDDSRIKAGQETLSKIPTYAFAIMISDAISLSLWLGLFLSSKKKHVKPSKCGECKKFEQETHSCSITHEGRAPEQPACSRAEGGVD